MCSTLETTEKGLLYLVTKAEAEADLHWQLKSHLFCLVILYRQDHLSFMGTGHHGLAPLHDQRQAQAQGRPQDGSELYCTGATDSTDHHDLAASARRSADARHPACGVTTALQHQRIEGNRHEERSTDTAKANACTKPSSGDDSSPVCVATETPEVRSEGLGTASSVRQAQTGQNHQCTQSPALNASNRLG
ncbi:hypothetical protein AC578_1480 [Pseudocercospora eumusae]|uniref:Uncharacterized protein n=1 Tax=Pseudocercospora eumusae TaxID=321146 RepID=A0A139H5D1_9PEZI|nr:hypothetical protein AC578_1480 [Pseudocercospora eumusae]